MISAAQMIYATRMMGTDIISCLRSKYITRQRRISYRVSDISLKKITFHDIILMKEVICMRNWAYLTEPRAYNGQTIYKVMIYEKE